MERVAGGLFSVDFRGGAGALAADGGEEAAAANGELPPAEDVGLRAFAEARFRELFDGLRGALELGDWGRRGGGGCALVYPHSLSAVLFVVV